MKDQAFLSQQTIVNAIGEIWNDFTFEDSSASFGNEWSAEPRSLEITANIIQTKDINVGMVSD
jgi:hypothetical protein